MAGATTGQQQRQQRGNGRKDKLGWRGVRQFRAGIDGLVVLRADALFLLMCPHAIS